MKWLCWLLVLCHHAAAQNTSGIILDADTKTPVAFATIKVLHSPEGTIATAKGEFTLHIAPADTILVTSIGYQPKRLTGNNIAYIIYLTPQPKMLDTVTIRPGMAGRTVVVGNGKNHLHRSLLCRYTSRGAKDNCWPWGPSNNKEEFAEKIAIDSSVIYRVLKIYVPTRRSDRYGPLLLSIYAGDSSGMPGEALLLKLVTINRSMIYKNKVVIDIAADNLYLSHYSSFFISLGWPPGETARSNFTTLALFAWDKQNTYTRSLVSSTYEWSAFGLGNNGSGHAKTLNTAYAVELEERVYQ